MINVYDWFESFQTILETQRMESLSRTRSTNDDDDDNNNNKRPKKRTRTRTPSPRKRGNKMKQGQTPAETEEGLERTPSPRKRGNKMKQQQAEAETEESLERWKVEVNARFIRALHELDYLGFIKHTNRKGRADHVLRTLFDVADDGFEE